MKIIRGKKDFPMTESLIYKDEYYKVIGICMEIHRILGKGLLEIVYKDAAEYEFEKQGIQNEREKEYPVPYKDIILPHKFYADFVIYNDIILEIKAVSAITDEHLAQTLNYMALAKSPLGIIVNFGTPSLQHKRVVLSETKKAAPLKPRDPLRNVPVKINPESNSWKSG